MNDSVVVWALSGSSIHKAYPWTDDVINALLVQTDATVVLTGDDLCRILEAGWEDEPRVLCRSGVWSIRETMTFLTSLEPGDCVVGPETGVLHAVGNLPIPKVVFLSHSTPEMLTKHWQNTIALESRGCHESPCHRMHYDRTFCPRYSADHLPVGSPARINVEGAAACAGSLPPETVLSAILEAMG